MHQLPDAFGVDSILWNLTPFAFLDDVRWQFGAPPMSNKLAKPSI